MKKLTAFFLALTLLLCAAVPVSAADPEAPELLVELAYLDESGLVQLTVSTGIEAAAGSFTLQYDNRDLSLEQLQVEGQFTSVQQGPSSVEASFVNRPARAGLLASFVFRYDAAQPPTTAVEVELTLTDAQENYSQDRQRLVLELADGESLCPTAAYDDLDASAWYHEATDYVLSQGIMQGVAPGSFLPDGTTTRAMFVTILGRLAGVDEARYGELKVFDDVAPGQWYAAYVNWACENEIVMGRGDGSFCPQDPITRQELVTVLARFAAWQGRDTAVADQSALEDFSDAEAVAEYARQAMAWAIENEIVNGNGQGLDPTGLASRVQTAKIIWKFQLSFE